MSAEQVRAATHRPGTDNSPRNPGQPPLNNDGVPPGNQARHLGMPAVTPTRASSRVQAVTPKSTTTSNMGNTAASAVLTAAGTSAPGTSVDSVVQSEQVPSWRNMRESTIAIRTKQGQTFTVDTAYDWIVELGLNPAEFKPVAAGLVNRNTEFHMTFSSKEKALRVVALAGDGVVVKGINKGSVELTDLLVHHMRIHWLPVWVDNTEIKDVLEESLQRNVHERAKVRVVKNETVKSKWGTTQTTVRHAVVTFPLEADAAETPGMIQIWKGASFIPGLVTVKGLPPKCLKCDRRGHIRTECEYPCKRCSAYDEEKGEETDGKWDHTQAEHEDWVKWKRDQKAIEDQKIIEMKIKADEAKIELEQQQIIERERKLAEDRQKTRAEENMDEDDQITVIKETQLTQTDSVEAVGIGADEKGKNNDDDGIAGSAFKKQKIDS